MEHANYSVAVLVAVYDKIAPADLDAALNSIAAQTRFPEEVLVAEDGPLTSEQERVLSTFATPVLPLRRVKLAQRSGAGPARQAMLEAASTELVAIADADDISLPNRIEREVAAMGHSGADLVASAVEEFDATSGAVLGVRRFASDHDSIVRSLRTRNPINHSTVLMRRRVAMEAGGYRGDVPLQADYDLWARIVAQGGRMLNLNEPLVRFRGGAVAQRRRRSAEALRAEWQLQKNLQAYGLIGPGRAAANLMMRTGYRVTPGPLADRIYRAAFLTRAP